MLFSQMSPKGPKVTREKLPVINSKEQLEVPHPQLKHQKINANHKVEVLKNRAHTPPPNNAEKGKAKSFFNFADTLANFLSPTAKEKKAQEKNKIQDYTVNLSELKNETSASEKVTSPKMTSPKSAQELNTKMVWLILGGIIISYFKNY